MIRYALHCARSHDFESWFQSADAFDRLSRAGHVACPVCGGSDVTKALMAPSIARDARSAALPGGSPVAAGPKEATDRAPRPAVQHPDRGTTPAQAAAPARALRGPPDTELERRLAELRDRIERESDYVGSRFAAEARAMHDGTVPDRPIWGEARPEDARKLIEDGVPVAPLPFLPRRKAH